MVTKSVSPAPSKAIAATSSVSADPRLPGKSLLATKLFKKLSATVKPAVKKRVISAAGMLVSSTPTPIEPVKMKKPKLVRDSFTMPKNEYAAIDALKLRAGKLGLSAKKSELLRAGIKALSAQSDIQFKAALSDVPTIKTGRPKDVK